MKERKRKKVGAATDEDPTAVVQAVLRESYLEALEDLRAYAEKVRDFNRRKKAVREYLASLREFKARVMIAARERGVDLCRGDKTDFAMLAKLFNEHARPCNVGEGEYELCVPNRVPRVEVVSAVLLENEIARWEERLATMSDEAQLVNIDLQNMLQKEQRILQMMSNISKMAHDATMAVIRNLKA